MTAIRALYWLLNMFIYVASATYFGSLVVIPLIAIDLLSWFDATGRMGKIWIGNFKHPGGE